MNFAFVTVLLVFITLLGIALRRSYFSSRFSIEYITTNLVNEIIWAIIPAILLHAFAILVVEATTSYQVLLENIGYLVVGGNDKERVPPIFQNIHAHIAPILTYNIGLTVFGILVGTGARSFVRGLSLDTLPYFSFLRFPNTWHYWFTGEYLNTERGWKYHKNIDFIMVDVLTNIGEGIIYSGILEDYYLSRTSGGLDRIIIKYPSKKTFSATGETHFREIPGNYLSIPYDNILNINIQYYEFNGAAENTQDDSQPSVEIIEP
ncbi:hypothetical protein AHMF7605_21605 [Adhaeribacter arboris]|uniref:Cytochrome oxidase subunit II transmembrane region profile domain-containing protein n=1 Tax=Adhaeribacter arboris TaxID=2072846 RepID=A0A2T2YK76_9BACT|nr:hypothetical protein [Adhaeribacter arboris]PSR55911.1 hypothetical protein AHMF7605_21605 [Adhaeribacter arboris]